MIVRASQNTRQCPHVGRSGEGRWLQLASISIEGSAVCVALWSDGSILDIAAAARAGASIEADILCYASMPGGNKADQGRFVASDWLLAHDGELSAGAAMDLK